MGDVNDTIRENMFVDGKPLTMTPCYGIGFMDGENIRARGFSWLPNGWLAAHFTDGAVLFYPEHFVKWVIMVPAEEFQEEGQEPVQVRQYGDPIEYDEEGNRLNDARDLTPEGELICPSCGDGVVMREVAQAHTRAICPQCGYRDPR